MAGTYAEYKQCTTQFTDWITAAAAAANKTAKKLPLTLAGLTRYCLLMQV
jgi:hypothetical protein